MPNRIIKESICYSEDIDKLTSDEEVFFYRLIVNCDDFGRMDARLAILLAKCYPLKLETLTIKSIDKWLKALIDRKLVTLYKADGKDYLFITKWDKHQQRRALNSKYPDPISYDINCNQTLSYAPEESRNRGIEESIHDKTENEKEASIPYQKIINLYHQLCPSFPKIRTVSNERKKHIGARFKQYDGNPQDFIDLFTKAEASDFLKGKNKNNWKATFDWMMNETNMAKILEGNFDNRESKEKEWQDPPH